ncbi:rod shape-determining protein MreC [Angustibacter sp. McL0619]|uniref:rod shape-determining protein MreC n=1 Tax=Angustibacter sp. McL0619 TaxID=3415676 RepID=UPI003CF37EF0
MLTLALLLLDLVASPGGASDRIRGVGSTVLGPAAGLVSGVGRAVSDAAAGLTGRNREQLDELRRQNDALRLAALAAQDDQRRAQEADALLRTAGLGRYRMVAARVVAISPEQATRRMVTLDAGSRDGVKTELTVLSGQGLVGRVVRVGPTTCDVLLLTDPSFSVGVRLEASGLIGVTTGNGDLPMSLKLLDAQTKVEPGARLVTLGSAGGSPFVPGVPVGEVRAVRTAPGTLSRAGSVTPYVEPATLDLVGVVVQPPRTDPRDAVLPPKPTPTQTSTQTATTGGQG